MAYETVMKSLTGATELIPAFMILVDRAKEANGESFNVSNIWKNEVEALSKTKFTFKDGNDEFTDSVLQFVDDDLNGDLIVKFSPFLPMDAEQDNKYNYKYQQAEYTAPKKISETLNYGGASGYSNSEPVKKSLSSIKETSQEILKRFWSGDVSDAERESPEYKKWWKKQVQIEEEQDSDWLKYIGNF